MSSIKTQVALLELRSVFNVLAADVEEALAYGRSTPTDFAKRSLFRTYFVQIEGFTTQFRRAAEAIASERTTLLTAEDRVLLPDQKAYLNDRGVARKLESFQPTLPAILFSMRCFGKAHGLVFEPELGGVGYASFKKLVKLRNSLTHPKSASDLALSDEQAAFALEAATWWKKTVLDLMERCRVPQQEWLDSS